MNLITLHCVPSMTDLGTIDAVKSIEECNSQTRLMEIVYSTV